MNLSLMVNTTLRAAIQENLVSFPAQIPAFVKGGEDQKQIVQLYFLRGWEIGAICDRYTLSKSVVRSILSEWKIRAVGAGYIQEIHPEGLAMLTTGEELGRKEALERFETECDSGTPNASWGDGFLHIAHSEARL